MPTCRTGRKRWALAAVALALLFPSPGRTAETAVIESVVYQGAKHIKDEELSALVAWLREEGRRFATCDLLSGGEAGDTRVVFNITEGPKVKVTGVEFVGNKFVSAAVLKFHLRSSEIGSALGMLGAPYRASAADADVRAIEDYYRSCGFHEAHAFCELRWAVDGHGVELVFHIEEGPRSRPSPPAWAEPTGGPVPLLHPW